jgi:hypothetical protein
MTLTEPHLPRHDAPGTARPIGSCQPIRYDRTPHHTIEVDVPTVDGGAWC